MALCEEGGFLAFQAMYPSLCESKTSSYRCAALTSLSQPCLPVSNVGPTRILPFLYLGSQQDALSPDIAQVNEITYVLNVSANGLKPACIPDGHFLRIPVNDNYSARLTPYFEQAFQFLDKVREANGCCLVHCLAGISRSPTLAIAYIMQHLNMSSDDAYRYVKDKRPTISPNFNFLGQLLDYEKQLKYEKEMNNNDEADGCQGNKNDGWVLPSPTLPTFNPPLAVSSKKGFSLSSDCIQSQGSSSSQPRGGMGLGRTLTFSQGTPDSPQQKTVNEGFKLQIANNEKVTKTGLSLKKSSFTLTFDSGTGVGSAVGRPNEAKVKQLSAARKDSPLSRPCVLNLGLDTNSRRVPFTKGREVSVVPSKSLSDITESSETPSPIVHASKQERLYSTSYSMETTPREVTPLLSPFPCGETTIRTKHVLNDVDHVPYSGKQTKQHSTVVVSEHSRVVKCEQSKHSRSEHSLTISSNTTSSLSESKTAVRPQAIPFSFNMNPVLKPGGKRPLRNSLSLPLSPVTPSTETIPQTLSMTVPTAVTTFAPSACKIERKFSHHTNTHASSSSSSSTTCSVSSIPEHSQQTPLSPMSSGTLTTSHVVKLKSFNLSNSLPLSLMAQSPTTSLAKLHFGSSENSDSETEVNKMEVSDTTPESPLPSMETNKLSYRKLNASLEKLSSFPSTSLDKLNFTACLSSSNENLLSNNTSPRTSGVKRPLNMDIMDIKDSEHASSVSPSTSSPLSSNSSVSSPTTSTQQKVVVRKREGRAKRSYVRPNSIAFSTYPTFDLGSDCQDSPHSSGSSTSQDDSSDLYTQNGKKSKPSEYMSDVRFRLGRYSEREVYRQITAAMEAAMMKSQSFEANRKSRSLDDILSSEDDNSSPNCEWSHFDRVLRRCGINRDKFSSPPHRLEKLACSSDLADLCHSNSSLSSAGSHTSLHGSVELIPVS